MWIRGGKVIDGTGEAPFFADIEIADGKVKSIRRSGKATGPDCVEGTMVNAHGKFILPGLVDSHNHLGLELGDEEAQMREPTPLIAIRSARRAWENLKTGVTTMRTMGEKDFIDVAYRKAIEEGSIRGPRVLVAGWAVTRTGGHGYYIAREADGPEEVRKAVRQNIKMGVDFIKLLVSGGGSTRSSTPTNIEMTLDEIRMAVNEAHMRRMKVAVHCHGGLPATYSIEAGVDSIEHGFFLNRRHLETMRHRGIFLVSTLGFLLIPKPAGEETRPQWYLDKLKLMKEKARDTMLMAREIGVDVAVGQDCDHGKLAGEIECLVELGWSPLQAIRAATERGAALCGLDDIGMVSVGKRADLVIVAKDPTVDVKALRSVDIVLKDGRIVYEYGKSPD